MEGIEALFENLEDPRTGHAKLHSLHEVLLIALCTVLCCGEGCSDMALFRRSKRAFLGQFLKLENGVPSHDTFSRIFRLLDPERFHAWFVNYMKQFAETCEGVVAIDGKTPTPFLRPGLGALAAPTGQCLTKRPEHKSSDTPAEPGPQKS